MDWQILFYATLIVIMVTGMAVGFFWLMVEHERLTVGLIVGALFIFFILGVYSLIMEAVK